MARNSAHKELNESALNWHNKLRALHHSPKLTIDWDLAKSAQAYAEKLAKTNSFSHSNSNGQYGENLASSYNSREGYVFTGDAATQNWYDEIKDYKFGEETQQTGKIGHFSQVVWKDTKTAGFGRAQSSSGNFIIVGQYKPPGNFIGHFKENVLASTGPPPKRAESPKSDSNQNKITKTKDSPKSSKKVGLCCPIGKKSKPTKSSPLKQTSSADIKPVIGPKNKDDQMIKSSTKTQTVNGKKTVEITETYQTPDGKTYERTKKTESKE